MTLLSGENISRRFNEQVLFESLSFSVNAGDRIGLVGPNGIGKTTLFEMMAGLSRPDSGEIIKSKSCRIGYIRQEISEYDDMSLFEFVCTAREELLQAREELTRIELALAEQPESKSLLQKLGEYQQQFETLGGYNFEAEIKIILVGLGFPENRFHNGLEVFSGGEKNRAALARILAGGDNLLLLDEPTNHLDIESTIWLEEYLQGLDSAYIIVSHDRAFLTNTVGKVWEITGKKINQYFNGFESFLKEREERLAQLEHRYRHQQEEIKRIEEFIRRNMAGQKTKQAQSRQKYLRRMKRVELPQNERLSPNFKVESSGRSHNLILAVEKADFGYGQHRLISGVDFNLYRGDRVGFIGQNGSGKTTLLKTILGDLDLIDGSVKIGGKVDLAYFDQELTDLNEDNIVIDELWQIDLTCEAGYLRSFLAKFGFRGEDVFKPVRYLSGGEKTKVALAKIMFRPANFLLFDEPTNHLDIDARHALEEALREYDGAFLIVSHDRYFLDRIAEKILAIEDGTLRIYPGNYSYYKSKQDEAVPEAVKKQPDPERFREYSDFKKLSQQKGRLKKEIRSTRSRIEDNERKLARLERELQYNIPKTDWEKLHEVAGEKSHLEEEILNLYNRVDELEKIYAEYIDPERQSD